MTSHELARKLLEMPDLPVTIDAGNEMDTRHLREDDICMMTGGVFHPEDLHGKAHIQIG